MTDGEFSSWNFMAEGRIQEELISLPKFSILQVNNFVSQRSLTWFFSILSSRSSLSSLLCNTILCSSLPRSLKCHSRWRILHQQHPWPKKAGLCHQVFTTYDRNTLQKMNYFYAHVPRCHDSSPGTGDASAGGAASCFEEKSFPQAEPPRCLPSLQHQVSIR